MSQQDHGASAEPKRDPVCGMIPKPDTPHRLTRDGEEVLFCSAGCKNKFEADPAKYTKPANDHSHCAGGVRAQGETAVADAPPGVKWTCPMHPEIVRDGPGSCPICGMALEPMTPSVDSGPNPEL